MRLIDPSLSWSWEACLRLIDPSFMVLGGQYAQRGVPHTVGRQVHPVRYMVGRHVPTYKGHTGRHIQGVHTRVYLWVYNSG